MVKLYVLAKLIFILGEYDSMEACNDVKDRLEGDVWYGEFELLCLKSSSSAMSVGEGNSPQH